MVKRICRTLIFLASMIILDSKRRINFRNKYFSFLVALARIRTSQAELRDALFNTRYHPLRKISKRFIVFPL